MKHPITTQHLPDTHIVREVQMWALVELLQAL
jgi:hypothetical protein